MVAAQVSRTPIVGQVPGAPIVNGAPTASPRRSAVVEGAVANGASGVTLVGLPGGADAVARTAPTAPVL